MKNDIDHINTFHGMPVNDFLKSIDYALSKGDRAEVVPVKDGVKVLRVRRETVHGGSAKIPCDKQEGIG